jgi:nitrogen fixation protein FixH
MATDREPWPWIVAGSLAAAIAVSLGFARVAVMHPDPLVVDDAYTAGLAWNRVQEARARAAAAGWRIALSAAAEGDGVRVTVAAADGDGRPLRAAQLSVRRVRPSEGGYDAEFALDAAGTAQIPLPRSGRWLLVARAASDGAALERVYQVVR